MANKWQQSMRTQITQYGLSNRFNKTLFRLGAYGLVGSTVAAAAYCYAIYIPRRDKYLSEMTKLASDEENIKRANRMAQYGIVGLSAQDERDKAKRAAKILGREEDILLAQDVTDFENKTSSNRKMKTLFEEYKRERDLEKTAGKKTRVAKPIRKKVEIPGVILTAVQQDSVDEIHAVKIDDPVTDEYIKVRGKHYLDFKGFSFEEMNDFLEEHAGKEGKEKVYDLINFWMLKNLNGAPECLQNDNKDACEVMYIDMTRKVLKFYKDVMPEVEETVLYSRNK